MAIFANVIRLIAFLFAFHCIIFANGRIFLVYASFFGDIANFAIDAFDRFAPFARHATRYRGAQVVGAFDFADLAFFGDARHALADGFIGWARLGLVDAIDATLQYVVCPCVASIDGALFAFGNATHFAGIIATVGAIGRLPARQGADFEFSVFARRFAQRAHASDECANALVATRSRTDRQTRQQNSYIPFMHRITPLH